jgi:hypothetical protein
MGGKVSEHLEAKIERLDKTLGILLEALTGLVGFVPPMFRKKLKLDEAIEAAKTAYEVGK